MAIAATLVFPAELEAVDGFRIEGHEFKDVFRVCNAIGGQANTIAVQVRSRGRLGARIETAAFEALAIGEVEIVRTAWLPGQRNRRAEIIPGIGAEEVGRGRDGKAGTAEILRETTQIGATQDLRCAFVFGVAATQGDADRVSQVIGEVTEDRPGGGVDIAEGLGIETGQDIVEQDVEDGRGIGFERVITDHTGETVAFIEQLQLFGGLLIGVDRRNVEIAFGKVIEIDRGR